MVKIVMMILIGFSIASWAIIIQRTRVLNAATRAADAFEDRFGLVSIWRVCIKKRQLAAMICPVRNKSFIQVSKSLPVYTVLMAMRQKR